MKKRMVTLILVILITMFILTQIAGPVSAATGKKVIDKGIANHKQFKSISLNWTATVYKNNKLEVHRYFSKNGKLYKVKKTTFERISRTKLKVTSTERYNKTTTKTSKYIKIKKGTNLTSYYLNKYHGKMLKNIATSKIFDSGGSYLSNIAHGYMDWSARVHYNNKVSIKEHVTGMQPSDKKTVIERSGKSKLKITTTVKSDTYVYNPKTKKHELNDAKTITYVKSKLSPKNYYLKVYKKKMSKHFTEHGGGCVSIHYPVEIRAIYKEIAYGDLINSSGKMEWTVNAMGNGKAIIIRNYTDSSFFNSTTTIEWSDVNTLKISTVYNGGNKSSETNYINYSSDLITYFLKIYRPEMLKLVTNVTIVKNETIPIPPPPMVNRITV